MQISVCSKSIVKQNWLWNLAAILKFKICAFVFQSELFKLKLILIQVNAITLTLP